MSHFQGSQPSRPIKVAQVIETMTMGGAENLAVRIANALPDRGFESHLIVITEPGILSERVDPRVKVHYLHYKRASIRNPVAFPFSILSGYRRLAGVIRSQGIGLVQTHLPGANFWGLLLALRGACRVLATIHNNQEFRYGDADSPVRSRLRRLAYKAIVNRCAGTIAVSEKVKTSLGQDLGLGPGAMDRITVVTNGVDVPGPVSDHERVAVRRELGLDLNLPLVVAAGRFGPQKNFQDLVSVAEILKKQGTTFQLLIAGEGEFHADLKARARDLGLDGTVFMPGNLQNLGQVMLAADVFAMTSLWEGLPLVLLEAMAAGLPAVAYGIPGVLELVVDRKTGYTVSEGDLSGIASRLAALLDDSELCLSMGTAARTKVLADFNFETLLSKLMARYS